MSYNGYHTERISLKCNLDPMDPTIKCIEITIPGINGINVLKLQYLALRIWLYLAYLALS